MSSFWDRLRGRQELSSADAARDRLKLVLVSDRSDVSPEKLAQLQAEIIDVIKRYLDVDDAHVQIKLEQRARENYLVADIPLARDTSYGALPAVEAPPEFESEAGPEAEPEPASEPEPAPKPAPKPRAAKAPHATKASKPRATSSTPRKPSARTKRTPAAGADPEPPAE